MCNATEKQVAGMTGGGAAARILQTLKPARGRRIPPLSTNVSLMRFHPHDSPKTGEQPENASRFTELKNIEGRG